MAKTVNLTWVQGQTYRWTYTWAMPDPASTPEVPLPPIPRDLSGCKAQMQLRQKYGAPVLLDLTTENGGLILGGVDGKVTIYATDGQTDSLGASSGDPMKPLLRVSYDLEIGFPSGDRMRSIEGVITIKPNITRDVP